MTVRLLSSHVPPDLRFAAAPVLACPGLTRMSLGVTADLSAETSLPHPSAVPAYLLYGDRDAVLIASGVESSEKLLGLLADSLQREHDPWHACLALTIGALKIVDEVFRSADLWGGNIYMAGSQSLSALGRVLPLPFSTGLAGADTRRLLRELSALELIYAFPVAAKFRCGGYDGDVQFRLNGWGRALAGRLPWPLTATVCEHAREVLRTHVNENYAAYARHLASFDISRQTYAVDLFASAQVLPVPVLV